MRLFSEESPYYPKLFLSSKGGWVGVGSECARCTRGVKISDPVASLDWRCIGLFQRFLYVLPSGDLMWLVMGVRSMVPWFFVVVVVVVGVCVVIDFDLLMISAQSLSKFFR